MDDIGKSRAEAAISRLAELNTYVFVRNLGGDPGQPITIDLVKGFQVGNLSWRLSIILIHSILLSGCRLGQCALAEAAGD